MHNLPVERNPEPATLRWYEAVPHLPLAHGVPLVDRATGAPLGLFARSDGQRAYLTNGDAVPLLGVAVDLRHPFGRAYLATLSAGAVDGVTRWADDSAEAALARAKQAEAWLYRLDNAERARQRARWFSDFAGVAGPAGRD